MSLREMHVSGPPWQTDGAVIWIEDEEVQVEYVTRDMALDAEEPAMEGMPMEQRRQIQRQIGQMDTAEQAAEVAALRNATPDLLEALDGASLLLGEFPQASSPFISKLRAALSRLKEAGLL